MVIYVDVLFVLNFFITYLLLLLTKLFNRKGAKMWRLLLASAFGGLYSLVILAPELNFMITFFGKFSVSVLIVFTSFGFRGIKQFLKNLAIFYFSNLVLLGVVVGLWLVAKPDGIAVKNDVIYFDISASTLLLSGLFAYVTALIIVKIHNSSISKNEIYSLTVYYGDNIVHLYAFADSGNKLREPFSNYPVIIADKEKLPFEANRIIPFSTVGGEGSLNAFKPDKVTVSFGKNEITTDRIYIAKSDVKSKEYSAILNSEILKL